MMRYEGLGIVIYFITAIICERKGKLSESHSLEDSPAIKDVLPYSKSLKLLLDFFLKYPNEIDMNMAFALSVAHDNLKHVLIYKSHKLPGELREYVETFLDSDGKLLLFFESMVKEDKTKNSRMRRISTLFLNRTLGVKGMFEFSKTRKSPLNLYRSTNRQWKSYQDKLMRYDRQRPSPTDNDRCLASLARNNMKKLQCTITYTCNDMLVNGTNFGYSLIYRSKMFCGILLYMRIPRPTKDLLIFWRRNLGVTSLFSFLVFTACLLLFFILNWLLHARRGRGCYILSPREDKELIDELCQNIFYEASYIAANRYGRLSLLLEQVTLCSLAGNAEFLRQSWMSETLKHQTPFGCFSSTLPVPTQLPTGYVDSSIPWTIYASSVYMLGGICNRQVTAVATGALSSALRYVLEEKSFANYIHN